MALIYQFLHHSYVTMTEKESLSNHEWIRINNIRDASSLLVDRSTIREISSFLAAATPPEVDSVDLNTNLIHASWTLENVRLFFHRVGAHANKTMAKFTCGRQVVLHIDWLYLRNTAGVTNWANFIQDIHAANYFGTDVYLADLLRYFWLCFSVKDEWVGNCFFTMALDAVLTVTRMVQSPLMMVEFLSLANVVDFHYLRRHIILAPIFHECYRVTK